MLRQNKVRKKKFLLYDSQFIPAGTDSRYDKFMFGPDYVCYGDKTRARFRRKNTCPQQSAALEAFVESQEEAMVELKMPLLSHLVAL